MKNILSKILFLTLIFSTNFCFAVEKLSENEELKEALSKNVYEPNWFSMIFGLFLVIGLVYLTGFLYQKLTKVKISKAEDELHKIEIVSTTSIGQGRNLHVIKVNGEYLLIGSTQNQISYLKEFNKINIKNLQEKLNENSKNS